ncbi:Hypothetical predicted protein [Paramuricea clavata]|uniref:Uncharacterized protein n=1 Tax=Paramuricea clavata TaxID=317549 RepID=A0A7D9D668_PARCT|nr:Hypothetical predicted protein [Paramuricea clavata]
MDANFYKFLELSGVTVSDDTNLTPLLADYWSFTAFAAEYPNNIYELNFIKWQLNGKNKTPTPSHNNTPQYQTPPQQVNTPQYQTSPQQISLPTPASPLNPGRVLTATEYPTLPVKLQKLKKHVNIVEGQFNAFTLETPQNPREPSETIAIDEKSATVDTDNKTIDIEPAFPSLTSYLEDFMATTEETQIPQVYTTSSKVIHRGKDITVARKKFEEEEEQEQEAETEKKEKKTTTRKRKRECGRPTTDQQLVRMDDDFNDMQALQLTRRQLTLPDTRGKCKKLKKILTKLPEDIIVNTTHEFQTYELFADTRAEALKIIQDKRELLEKINAAEYVLHTLLKKRNNSDSSS